MPLRIKLSIPRFVVILTMVVILQIILLWSPHSNLERFKIDTKYKASYIEVEIVEVAKVSMDFV